MVLEYPGVLWLCLGGAVFRCEVCGQRARADHRWRWHWAFHESGAGVREVCAACALRARELELGWVSG